MSTAAQIRTAWANNVWNNASITAITTKIYDREMPKDITGAQTTNSQKERLLYSYKYNFIEYVITKHDDGGAIGQRKYSYDVNVLVNRQTDNDGTEHNACIDTLNTIFNVVNTNLGTTWQGTVDRWLPLSGQPQINFYSIENVRIIRARRVFRAEKYE